LTSRWLVATGKTPLKGRVLRANVTGVVARLLENDFIGRVDYLKGTEQVDDSIVREKVDYVEGENVKRLVAEHEVVRD